MTVANVAPVLVTGATGRIGSLVAEELVAAGVPVRAMSRQADAAPQPPAGVDVVAGDFTVPDSLGRALAGIDTAFLVWTAPPGTLPDVIDRLAARVRRVVFLSSPHQTPHPFFQQPNPMAVLHADIERRLVASGIEATFIRPGMFASNVVHWWGPAIRAGDSGRWPYAAAETAPIDERDVAAVAARTLYDDAHSGGDYVLTGPESLSQAEQIRIIGDVLGRRLELDELTADEFRSETSGVWPPRVVDMLLDAWAATMGQPAYVTSTVSEILGGPARTFRQWAVDNATVFTA